MHSFKRLGTVAAAGATLAFGGAAVAGATSTSSHHARGHAACGHHAGHAGRHARGPLITGPAAVQASTAALSATGPGRVVAVRAARHGIGFRVTVVRPDGVRLHVHLGAGFEVLRIRAACARTPNVA